MRRFPQPIRPRGSKRRGGAVQTRRRGGCSGGGWPRPSGRASLRWSAIVSDRIGNGCEMIADRAGKPTDPQAAMKTHLSQSAGKGAFDGQHGMSLAISSIVSADISDDAISDEASSGDVILSAIACRAAGEDVAAITGRETGANARPAIIRIASNRRMAKLGFTTPDSHRLVAMERSPAFNLRDFCQAGIDRNQCRFAPLLTRINPQSSVPARLCQPAVRRGPTRHRAARSAFPLSGSSAPRPVFRYRCR
jgi:hypothetical protein